MSTDLPGPAKTEPRKPIILTVDDDPNNLSVLHDCLEVCDYTILAAEDGESAIRRANYAMPDLILLDVMMPGIDGLETCRRLKSMEKTKEVPVIFMTALADTVHKVKGLESGAVDYITKPFQREELLARIAVHLHNRELTRELQEAKGTLERRVEERTMDLAVTNFELEEEIGERQMVQEQLQEQTLALEVKVAELQRTQAALQESERKFRVIFEQTFQLMGLLTPDGTLLEANQTALDFCGISAPEVIGKPFWASPWWAHSEELRVKVREGVTVAAAGELVRFEATHPGREGKLHVIDFSFKPVLDEQGRVIQLIAEGRDITTLKKLEKDLRQSQKMEAIGTLAGGIAHDFNNILTAIMGYTDLAQRKVAPDESIGRDLVRVQEASIRAKDLVKQILVFSRQGELERKPVQLSPVIEDVLKLLRSSLPTTIEIRHLRTSSSKGCTVLANQTQLHQVLMNLGTNAAHAMRAHGGVLSVSLSDITAEAALIALYPDLSPGPYVHLRVSDTGHGMEASVKERIFDPYFTTKSMGEGTGIGLAVVQGIVKSHGGAISVYSEPGQGTTFHVFLPTIVDELVNDTHADEPCYGGTERILFVDDERALAELGQELLGCLGYDVSVTSSSVEALEIFRSTPRAFDLIITDLTMPVMTGKDLAREMLAVRVDIPIILCTGFSDIINEQQAKEMGIKSFVMKPYSIDTLDQIIRKILPASTPASPM